MNSWFSSHRAPYVRRITVVVIMLGTVSVLVLPVSPLLTLALLFGGSMLGLILAPRRPRQPHRPPWALGWHRAPVRRPRSPVTHRRPVRRWRMPHVPCPQRRPRSRPQPRGGAIPEPVPLATVTVATLAGVVSSCLPFTTGGITMVRHMPRQIQVDLGDGGDRCQAIRESITPTLPQARLRGPTIQIPLPPVMAPATTAPCPSLPLTRRGRTTTWTPLTTLGHLVLAGPATYVLAAQLASLLPFVPVGTLRLLCDDPEELLPTLPLTGVRGCADARVQARQTALQHTWHHQQQGTIPTAPPLVLVAIQPDAPAWADLVPLLTIPPAGVHVLVLLGTTHLPVVRTICHQVPVLEVGGAGASALPDAARPTGLARPRTGHSVYWQAGQVWGRGHTLCRDETALYQDWLDLPRLGGG